MIKIDNYHYHEPDGISESVRWTTTVEVVHEATALALHSDHGLRIVLGAVAPFRVLHRNSSLVHYKASQSTRKWRFQFNTTFIS